MIEVRTAQMAGPWFPAGDLAPFGRGLVAALLNAGVVSARLEMASGVVIEMRSSEPGEVGPGAGT